MYRRDRNCFDGGLLFNENGNLSSRELTTAPVDSNFEIIFLEITVRRRKLLIIGLYKPANKKWS